jgi:hypothetical protein
MGPTDWLDQIEVIISSCDDYGITTYMNKKGSKVFAGSGGYELIGKNMADCHPKGAVREKFIELLKSQKFNCYTIEVKGKKKLVYQMPLFKDGTFVGYTEMIMSIPDNIPHLVRGTENTEHTT